jgi:hypothetical protein
MGSLTLQERLLALADAPSNTKLEEGGWLGSLEPGPNPPPEGYPLDCCTWGAYVRFHGSEGQVGASVWPTPLVAVLLCSCEEMRLDVI